MRWMCYHWFSLCAESPHWNSKSALHSQRIRLIAVLYGSLSFVNEGVNYCSKFIFDCPCLGWVAPVFVHKFNQVCFTRVAFILNVFTSCSMQVKGWESLHLKYLIWYIISWSILQKRKLKTLVSKSNIVNDVELLNYINEKSYVSLKFCSQWTWKFISIVKAFPSIGSIHNKPTQPT
jgi:hypothetical protein